MKLKVYDQTERSELVVCLKLVQEGDDVLVIAVNPDGKRLYAGDLIRFNRDGTIRLFESVNPDIGFHLDEQGRIKLLGR